MKNKLPKVELKFDGNSRYKLPRVETLQTIQYNTENFKRDQEMNTTDHIEKESNLELYKNAKPKSKCKIKDDNANNRVIRNSFSNVNYDKIIRSYMDFNGYKNNDYVFVQNQEIPQAQYFSYKKKNDGDNPGMNVLREYLNDSLNDGNIDASEDQDTSRGLINRFRLIPNKSESPKENQYEYSPNLKHLKEIKQVAKLKQRLQKEESNKEHLFSLPSLNTNQISRIQNIEEMNKRYIRHKAVTLEKQISRQAENDIRKSTDIARCSAVFLSKHVHSLNRKPSQEKNSKISIRRDYYFSRNPSLSNKKISLIDEISARKLEMIASKMNESTHHKCKYLYDMPEFNENNDYKPLDTLQKFMKKIEKNEYYKERIYDNDIYNTGKSK